MPSAGNGKSLPEKLKAGVVRVGTAALNTARIARADFLMRQCDRGRKQTSERPIRVGFIAQMPEVWDKQISLFRFMLDDPRFEPEIIYLNHYDFVQKRISDTDDRDKSFYENLHGAEHVRSFSADASLRPGQYDYLFYDRPYNFYFPDCLKTGEAMKHARLCNINYGADDWDLPFVYMDFALGIRFWFASNTHEYNLHRSVFHNSKYHRVFDLGYPAFELYHALESVPGKNRILWTPRWSYDAEVGGSHFFEYVEQMIDFAAHHDVSLVIRPHPLMFDNLIQEKKLTEEDVRNLKQRCADAGIRFDPNRIVADTFRETDILISDYSSILGLFLATDKPIIYCPSGIPLNEECLRQVDAMYHAENWQAIEQTLLMLLDGKDPMKTKRQEVITDSLLKRQHAVEAIADVLDRDFHS